jgi:hypothetical protein
LTDVEIENTDDTFNLSGNIISGEVSSALQDSIDRLIISTTVIDDYRAEHSSSEVGQLIDDYRAEHSSSEVDQVIDDYRAKDFSSEVGQVINDYRVEDFSSKVGQVIEDLILPVVSSHEIKSSSDGLEQHLNSDDDIDDNSTSTSTTEDENNDHSVMNLSKKERKERNIILHRCQTSNTRGCLLRRSTGKSHKTY